MISEFTLSILQFFSSFYNFNQAIETATWQQIKQYDNSVAGAYKIVDANGNIIYRFFAWLIQFFQNFGWLYGGGRV